MEMAKPGSVFLSMSLEVGGAYIFHVLVFKTPDGKEVRDCFSSNSKETVLLNMNRLKDFLGEVIEEVQLDEEYVRYNFVGGEYFAFTFKSGDKLWEL